MIRDSFYSKLVSFLPTSHFPKITINKSEKNINTKSISHAQRLIFASRYKQIQSRKHIIPKGLPLVGSKWAQKSQILWVLQKASDLESGVCMWSYRRGAGLTWSTSPLQLGHRSKVKHDSKGLKLPIQPTPWGQGRRTGGLFPARRTLAGWISSWDRLVGRCHHAGHPTPCSEGPSVANCINLLKLPHENTTDWVS